MGERKKLTRMEATGGELVTVYAAAAAGIPGDRTRHVLKTVESIWGDGFGGYNELGVPPKRLLAEMLGFEPMGLVAAALMAHEDLVRACAGSRPR